MSSVILIIMDLRVQITAGRGMTNSAITPAANLEIDYAYQDGKDRTAISVSNNFFVSFDFMVFLFFCFWRWGEEGEEQKGNLNAMEGFKFVKNGYVVPVERTDGTGPLMYGSNGKPQKKCFKSDF